MNVWRLIILYLDCCCIFLYTQSLSHLCTYVCSVQKSVSHFFALHMYVDMYETVKQYGVKACEAMASIFRADFFVLAVNWSLDGHQGWKSNINNIGLPM
jgi:hypothetical protein